MTTVLNRKFDLLCHSGTCPSYLVDVLSLLVAHANDTELFKSELRICGGAEAHRIASPVSRGNSADRPDQMPRDVGERGAADRRTQLMYRQVEDPEALDDALRASHESVLIAAEKSLQTYAEDLRHMNEIAMATAAKQLRSMRVETQQQMEEFRDRVCAGTVSQTREELEVMRSEFGASVKEDVSAMVRQLHEVSLRAQQQVQELTASFGEFVADTHAATVVVPLGDAHEALAAVEFMEERMSCVEAAAASRADVDTLESRLRELERVVAALGSAISAPPNGNGAPPLPALTAVMPDLESTALATSLSLSNGQVAPAAKQVSRQPLDPQSSLEDVNAAAREPTASKAAAPLVPAAAGVAAPSPSTCAERLGLVVESAEEGVVLSTVAPDSVAAHHQLGAGHIVSHVGRVAVTTAAAFEAALQSSEGQALKLTTYDPFQGRIRILTIPSW